MRVSVPQGKDIFFPLELETAPHLFLIETESARLREAGHLEHLQVEDHSVHPLVKDHLEHLQVVDHLVSLQVAEVLPMDVREDRCL